MWDMELLQNLEAEVEEEKHRKLSNLESWD